MSAPSLLRPALFQPRLARYVLQRVLHGQGGDTWWPAFVFQLLRLACYVASVVLYFIVAARDTTSTVGVRRAREIAACACWLADRLRRCPAQHQSRSDAMFIAQYVLVCVAMLETAIRWVGLVFGLAAIRSLLTPWPLDRAGRSFITSYEQWQNRVLSMFDLINVALFVNLTVATDAAHVTKHPRPRASGGWPPHCVDRNSAIFLPPRSSTCGARGLCCGASCGFSLRLGTPLCSPTKQNRYLTPVAAPRSPSRTTRGSGPRRASCP